MRVLMCIALWCCTISLHSQPDQQCPWSISGIVLDEHDAASLGYATIYVKELERGVVSDSAGRFLITGICEGSYTLQFSHVGCETKEQTIRVRNHLNLTLHLEHHAELLEAIELSARRIREAGTVARTELDVSTLARSTGRSIGETLVQLPGVTALQTGPSIFKPVIQGLHSNRVLILKDGMRLESHQWGLDHAPEIDLNTASQISVLKGTAAVQYGTEAVAGVILVESEDLPTDQSYSGDIRLTGVTNGGQIAASSTFTRGLGRGMGLRLNAGIRRAGDARAADYLLTNTGISEVSAGMEIGYRKGLRSIRLSYQLFGSEIGILRSAHIGNLTDLQDALQRERPLIVEDFSYQIRNPKQTVLHHTLRIAGQTHIERLGVFNADYAIQWNNREEFDIRRGGRDDIPALDLRLQTHTATIGLAHDQIGRLRGKIGLHWTFQQNSNTPGTGVRPLIPNYTEYVPAISLVEKWIAGDLELEAGLRYEYRILNVKRFDAQNVLLKPQLRYHSYAGSAGIRYALSGSLTLYSHLGSTRRAPQVNELFSEGLHHGAAAIEEGDTALVPERSLKWVTGTTVQTQRWKLDASVFVHHVNDFIYLRPIGEPRLTIRGAFPVFLYVQDDVRLIGAEYSLQFAMTPSLQLRSQYALVRARNLSLKEGLIGMPSDRMRHTLSWIKQDHALDAELTAEYVWRQSNVPEEADYAPPPDGYLLLHTGIGKDLFSSRLHAHLSVRNLLNTSYREYLNRLRYYADDTGRSIELRLRYTF